MGYRRSLTLLALLTLAAIVPVGCWESSSPDAPPDPEPARRRPDLVVVTWDTVRWDHVGASESAPSNTPGWDALAREGVVFVEARTPAPMTLPAHASLLTGLTPAGHGARVNSLFVVDSSASSLAEELHRAGYATGAFVSSVVLDAQTGLARGFDHYDDAVEPAHSMDTLPARGGERTVQSALAWCASVSAETPLFLWVHLFDPHRPWNAPSPFSEDFDPYRAEIAFADAQTRLLLEVLKATRGLSNAAVVVTSDHGEDLGDHGEFTHGYFAYDSTVRVPLLIWAGEQAGVALQPGLQVAGPVSLLDVAPTLREIAGIAPRHSDGRSLLPQLGGELAPPRELTVESLTPTYSHAAAPIFGVLTRDREAWFDVPRRERYDLSSDPDQLHNLYSPDDVGRADTLFARFDFGWPPDQTPATLDEQQRAALEALGYFVDAASSAAAAREWPDPKDRIAMHRLLTLKGELDTRNPRKTLRQLETLRETRGVSPALVKVELLTLQSLGRPLDALALARETLAEFPENKDLAATVASLSRAEREARKRLLSARARVAARPDDADALDALAGLLMSLQEFDEVIAVGERIRALDPDRPGSVLRQAMALTAAGRDAEAVARFDHLRSLEGRSADQDCEAGRALARVLDEPERGRAAIEDCRAAAGQLTELDLQILSGS